MAVIKEGNARGRRIEKEVKEKREIIKKLEKILIKKREEEKGRSKGCNEECREQKKRVMQELTRWRKGKVRKDIRERKSDKKNYVKRGISRKMIDGWNARKAKPAGQRRRKDECSGINMKKWESYFMRQL